MVIPADRRARNPLITQRSYRLLRRIQQHADAPRWNFVLGDRVLADDLERVEAYRRALAEPRSIRAAAPPAALLTWVEALRPRVPLLSDRLPAGFEIARDWAHVPTMTREDLAVRPEAVVPLDADLERLIVYDTSGTTGHALRLPHHPRTVALAQALIERVLDQHGVPTEFGPDEVACVNVCAQTHTYVFANVMSVWGGSGLAKVNLHPDGWAGGVESARRFLAEAAPRLITGDPVAFAELKRWEVPVRPALMLSTAVALSPGLRGRLQDHFGCPVVDWYSTTETGPIAATCPGADGLRVLPHDLWVEALDDDGLPVADGSRGELTVTGGRNPYLPLVRYRTGDYGRLVRDVAGVRILDLEARDPVFFRATDGGIVNPVDLGRIMRLHSVFVQHQLLQRADGSCLVRVRPAAGCPVDLAGLEARLRTLLGDDAVLELRLDEALGADAPGGKVVPYVSELDLP